MREILRCPKEEFEQCTEVVKSCLELTQAKDLRALRQEEKPVDEKTVRLENCASAFLKCYLRQYCSVYADLLFELKETEVEPKKVPKDGEEPEEEDDDMKEKRKKNDAVKEQFSVIQPQLFHTWILLCQKFSEEVTTIQTYLATKENDLIAFNEALDNVDLVYKSNESLNKHMRIMVCFFNFIELEVTWLDEIAEGLKNVIASSNDFRNFVDGLRVELRWKVQT